MRGGGVLLSYLVCGDSGEDQQLGEKEDQGIGWTGPKSVPASRPLVAAGLLPPALDVDLPWLDICFLTDAGG